MYVYAYKCTWDWGQREWDWKRERGGAFSEATTKHLFNSFTYSWGSSFLTKNDIASEPLQLRHCEPVREREHEHEDGGRGGTSDTIVEASVRARWRNSRHSTSGTRLFFGIFLGKVRSDNREVFFFLSFLKEKESVNVILFFLFYFILIWFGACKC